MIDPNTPSPLGSMDAAAPAAKSAAPSVPKFGLQGKQQRIAIILSKNRKAGMKVPQRKVMGK